MGSSVSHPSLISALDSIPTDQDSLTLDAAKQKIVELRKAARDHVDKPREADGAILSRQNSYNFKPSSAPDSTASSKSKPIRVRHSLPPTRSAYKETNTVKSEIDQSGNEVINQYTLLEVLGRGSFAIVRRCTDAEGHSYAIKIFNKKRLRRKRIGRFGNAMQTVGRELAVWKKLTHPNVLPLIEAIDSEESDELYFVSKLVNGGSVMPDESKCEPISEVHAKDLFRQLILALDYLHFQNVVHRDVKPGNLLIEKSEEIDPNSPGRLILADFGVAHTFDGDDDTLSTTEGTLAFMAPEMCTGAAFSAKPTDIWAAGATLYMFVVGTPPFQARNIGEFHEAIQNNPVVYPEGMEISAGLKDLIERILVKDPLKRSTIQSIMEHPWLTDDGKNPLRQRDRNSLISITNDDVQSAITPITRSTALFIVVRSSALAKKARESIKMKNALMAMKGV